MSHNYIINKKHNTVQKHNDILVMCCKTNISKNVVVLLKDYVFDTSHT